MSNQGPRPGDDLMHHVSFFSIGQDISSALQSSCSGDDFINYPARMQLLNFEVCVGVGPTFLQNRRPRLGAFGARWSQGVRSQAGLHRDVRTPVARKTVPRQAMAARAPLPA